MIRLFLTRRRAPFQHGDVARNNPRWLFFVLSFLLAGARPAWSQAQSAANPVLEITYKKGTPPSLQSPAPIGAEPAGGWSTNVTRLTAGRGETRTNPVFAVQVKSRMESRDTAKVWVSVLLGQPVPQTERAVGTYEIRVNESFSVHELESFFIEPIDLKLTLIARKPAIIPKVVNKTQSLAVTRLAPLETTQPSFRADFKNNSDKEVAAFGWEVAIGGRMAVSSLSQGIEGRSLVSSKGTYAIAVPAKYQTNVPEDVLQSILSEGHDFILKSVIFADGSYEGDAGSAAEFRGFTRGRRIEVGRITELLANFVENGTEPSAVFDFKGGLLALSTAVTTVESRGLQDEFPNLPAADKAQFDRTIEIAVTSTKKQFLDEFTAFEKSQQPSIRPAAFREWIQKTYGKYSTWRDRLGR